jgi:hypothetical protein
MAVAAHSRATYVPACLLVVEAEGVAVTSAARMPGPISARPAGHRVLPVFVLSLLGLPPGLLIDKQHLQVASGHSSGAHGGAQVCGAQCASKLT